MVLGAVVGAAGESTLACLMFFYLGPSVSLGGFSLAVASVNGQKTNQINRPKCRQADGQLDRQMGRETGRKAG